MTPPYQLHTNRELGMMLRGEKPLAVFAFVSDEVPAAAERYFSFFDRHVATGRLVKEIEIVPPQRGHDFTIKRFYFALPSERWRIAAMMELKASGTWSLWHERREGELLGYADWQNDWHIEHLERPKA